jgi:hypothetical protein
MINARKERHRAVEIADPDLGGAGVEVEGLQQVGDLALAVGVGESWRWTHDDMSMPVGLDPVGELSELRVGQDLGPTSQVEPGLRSEIWKLNGDRHARKIHQKRKRSKRPGQFAHRVAIGCVGDNSKP